MASSKEIQINSHRVAVLNNSLTPAKFVTTLANSRSSQQKHSAFYVADLSDIIRKYRENWSVQLPRLYPHYAVKCNDNPVVLAIMARLGIGFDCASKKEMKQVLQLLQSDKQATSVHNSSQLAERIIFANTCKKPSHIRFAADAGVKLMTFDSESELYKVKDFHPNADMVVRLKRKDGSRDGNPLNIDEKFGCTEKVAIGLLGVAKQLGINVVGVAFHVGSLCFDRVDPTAYVDLIESSRVIFDAAETIGFKFKLLDIGGAFLGNKQPAVPFTEVAAAIRSAVDRLFPDRPELKIIAEPGRYFVTSAFTLANNILGVKCVVDGDTVLESDAIDSDDVVYHYTLIDGSFGTMMAHTPLLARGMTAVPTVLEGVGGDQLHPSVLWGPTCCGYDVISRSCLLPKQTVGDWIVFEDMGSYTITLATQFNNMPRTKVVYVINEKDAEEFSD